MTVTSYRGKPTHQSDLGELDPRDDGHRSRRGHIRAGQFEHLQP